MSLSGDFAGLLSPGLDRLHGLDRLQPPWSKSAVAEAARVAALQAAAGYESDDSRNSENFLLQHMHQWSRDSTSDVSFPPPPLSEDLRLSHRFGRAPSDHGAGRASLTEVIPEEVPIMRPGIEREECEAQRIIPIGFRHGAGAGLEDMSTVYPISEASPALSSPWSHGSQARMRLPQPPPGDTFSQSDYAQNFGIHQVQGYGQDFFSSPAAPSSASPGASPYYPHGSALPGPPTTLPTHPPPLSFPASPMYLPQAARPQDAFLRWRPTYDAYSAPLPQPEQETEASNGRSWMPWRFAQQRHEEHAPFREVEERLPQWQCRDEAWEASPRSDDPSQHNPSVALQEKPQGSLARFNLALPEVPHEGLRGHQDQPCPMPSPYPAIKAEKQDSGSSDHASYTLDTIDINLHPSIGPVASHALVSKYLTNATTASRVSFSAEVLEEEISPRSASQTNEPVASVSQARPSNSKTSSFRNASLSKLLSPKRKEMLGAHSSFQVSALPVLVDGRITSRSTASRASNPESIGCLTALCGAWNKLDLPLLIPCCTLLMSLIFTCGCAILLWSAEMPDVAEGAFGLISQTKRNASISFSHFEKAREHTIASLESLDRDSDEGRASASFSYQNNTRAWYRVEVLYSKTGGGLLEQQNVEQIRAVEKSMRDLPGWKKFCEQKVQLEARHFCNPGDSFAAVAFGSNQPADKTEAALGEKNKVVYDARGASMIMPLEPFVQYLKDFQQAALKRWFAMIDTNLHSSPMRSMFAFYLEQKEFPEWEAFMRDELEPFLHEEASKGDGSNGDGTGYETEEREVRIFYRADGLVSKEFVRAVAQDAPMRSVAPLGVFFSVLFTSRRVLLAIMAAVLSLTAPLIASTLAASRGPTGRLEYAATTVAAWFLVAIACCELALATANAWEFKDDAPELPGFLKEIPGWHVMYRLLRFLWEVPGPIGAPCMALFICGFVVDLPLVTEFTLHVSLGLAAACIFGVLVYPPACEVGDKLRDRALNSEAMKGMKERVFFCLLPYEAGGQPRFVEKMEELTKHMIRALGSKTVRTVAFLATLAVLISACFKETSPNFVPDTPELFHAGHRLRVAPKVRELFGSGELVGVSGAPSPTLRFARKCAPDAYDELECSWYKCEMDENTKIEKGTCSCLKQTAGEDRGIRQCGAVARFANLPLGSDAFAKVSFWRWAEEELKVLIVNNSVSAWKMGALEMESWATGKVTTEQQLVVKTHAADGQAPLWEDACLRMLCYCGPNQCKLDDTWKPFGTPEIVAPDRRLEYLSRSTFQTSALRNGEDDHYEIYTVWGLRQTDEIPRKYVKQHFDFSNFGIQSPWVQRSVFGFCSGLPPRLGVVERRCWILDFKRWLVSRGERFPVHSEVFYNRFHHFVAHYASLQLEQPGRDSYNYFWLNNSGAILGCYAMFKGHTENMGRTEADWEEYLKFRNEYAYPAAFAEGAHRAWLVSPQFAASEAERAVKEAAVNMVSLQFVTLTFVTLFLSWSPGLTAATVLISAITLGILVGIGVGLGRRDFGAMEVTALATFMSILITPLIRVAHQYTLARDGPGDDPHDQSHEATDSSIGFAPRNANITFHEELQLAIQSPRPEEEEYLVDNSLLRAKTCGLAYRLSPNLKDKDHNAHGYQGLAPWGSTVVGRRTKCGEWLKVGNRFLPMELNDNRVLTWQEREKPPERVFSPESSESGPDTCMEDLKVSIFGPYDVVKIWSGATFEERKRRSLTAVKRASHTVLGASLAGVVAGLGLVPMRMQALGRIGLASLCASVTVPTAALGLLPMLAMVNVVGPSRVRRRAFAEFAEWFMQGFPRGSQRAEEPKVSTISDGSSHADQRNIGEIAADVLGLPFSLMVKTPEEHFPECLQWIIGNRGKTYYPAQAKAARKLKRLRSESYD